MLYEPSEIKRLKNKYGFRFQRSLGQNFLVDGEAVAGIVEGAGISEDDLVIEIGPGIGVLTESIAPRAGKVVAVEIDEGLIEIMKDTLSGHENIKIVNDNILKTDLGKLIARERDGFRHVKLCGNLPYYITSPILMKVLSEHGAYESATFMMQKEVAERIAAPPGGKDYGALTVAVRMRAEVTVIEEVGKESFMPSPKVDSEVIRLDMLDEPAVSTKDEDLFFRIVRGAFSQRRKTLLNSLGAAGIKKEDVRDTLMETGIDEKRRAETLSLEEFAVIADTLAGKGYGCLNS